MSDGKEIIVSAIVSVFKAGKYIEGCLSDLVQQSIADQMEIIIIDSASDEGEDRVIRSYQDKYNNIIYLRTAERETVYAAWNRGIRLASGKYITNANTDDRHRKDAFEVMATALEQHPEVALVYADLLITETENQTFENCTPTGRFGWLDWDRRKLLEGQCFMGPQPMWRKSLHKEYGYFRSDFVTSGDYEFWLRISQTHEFLHLPQVLGLYLKTPNSIEHSNRDAQTRENIAILSEYQPAAKDGVIVNRTLPQTADSIMRLAITTFEMGCIEQAYNFAAAGLLLENPSIATLCHVAGIVAGGVETAKVDALYKAAIEFFPDNKALLYQYIGILLSQGRSKESLEFIERSIIRFGHEDGILEHGLTIRKIIGPLNNVDAIGQAPKTSLCVVLDKEHHDLALMLQKAKKQADEIVAIDAGTSNTVCQIAEIFGARVFRRSDFPEHNSPWEIATRVAKGENIVRLALES